MRNISKNEFFEEFGNFISIQKEVQNFEAITTVTVPILKLTLNGIKIDILQVKIKKEIQANCNLDEIDIGEVAIEDIRGLCGLKYTIEIGRIVGIHHVKFSFFTRAMKYFFQCK